MFISDQSQNTLLLTIVLNFHPFFSQLLSFLHLQVQGPEGAKRYGNFYDYNHMLGHLTKHAKPQRALIVSTFYEII